MIPLSQMFLKYKYTVILFVLYTISAFYIINNSDDGVWVCVVFSLINAIVLTIAGLYISRTGWLSFFILFPIAILLTAPVTYRIIYSSPLNIGAIASVLETNRVEAFGVGLPILLVAIPMLLLFYWLLCLSVKELGKLKIRLRYLSIGVLACMILAVTLVPLCITGGRKAQFDNFMKSDPVLYLENRATWRFPLVIAPALSLGCYFTEMIHFRKQLGKERTLPHYISFDREDNETINTIFVVIGESSVPDHYSLYGYGKKTTPFLDSLRLANALSFYRAISPAPFTRDALRLTLSFATAEDKEPFYKYENNVGLANNAGYETYWISNQNIVGLDDSYIGMLAYYAKTTLFYNYQNDDIDLVSDVREHYDPDTKQVFYLHLKGSHLPYDAYDEVDTRALGEHDEFAKYDKTIHHTDRVIQSLYSYITKQGAGNSVILYYSDHGEVVNKGHGFFTNQEVQFRIPFVMMPVDAKMDVNAIIKKYFTNDYFNSVNLNYVLSELMGYSVNEKAVIQARKDGLLVYHVDGKSYCFACED